MVGRGGDECPSVVARSVEAANRPAPDGRGFAIGLITRFKTTQNRVRKLILCIHVRPMGSGFRNAQSLPLRNRGLGPLAVVAHAQERPQLLKLGPWGFSETRSGHPRTGSRWRASHQTQAWPETRRDLTQSAKARSRPPTDAGGRERSQEKVRSRLPR